MFSILISVFNYDCTELVGELINSCSLAKTDYEIIVGNDCSTDPDVLQALKKIDALPHCRVFNEAHNVGKAYMLYHLADIAIYPYLIIIDSDARLLRDDFIERYLHAATGHDVVSGHVVVLESALRADNRLRYRYEFAAAGERALDYRRRHPYKNLCTINLLIRRSVFLATPFPKDCYQYGYEDTILGIDLEDMGVEIYHIDNPLIHNDIDSNHSFIGKTHKALHVLAGLDRFYKERIRISRTALKLQRWHLLWAVKVWHRLFGALERRMLMRWPSVTLFNIYKLGYYSLINPK
ncbi:MAG: glycosyltransferase [Bacteroidaceae bacterium]|nr:glycosyltransferase [Bacteroidaceae bacterium]MBO4592893.1 glycosyltransferase [Bacteroidaceae bacterium]